MKRILLITAGNVSLSLGIAGIFLPVLPTTPFLLLSAACYVKSSEKLYLWLINHRILGLYTKSYIIYKAITLKAKIISIAALWAVISVSAFFVIDLIWLRILLFVIAAGVTFYIANIKTLTMDMIREYESSEDSSDN